MLNVIREKNAQNASWEFPLKITSVFKLISCTVSTITEWWTKYIRWYQKYVEHWRWKKIIIYIKWRTKLFTGELKCYSERKTLDYGWNMMTIKMWTLPQNSMRRDPQKPFAFWMLSMVKPTLIQLQNLVYGEYSSHSSKN